MKRPSRTLRCCLVALMGILALLPTTPGVFAQSQRCFPETGYCIDGRFRTYWEQNGGLQVFGYPITAARNEVNRETGETFLTQWFERNRFEYHPENAAPYDVLLGRLGDDRLLQRGIDWRTAPRESGARQGCLWFAETGHNVCDQAAGAGFRTYWQSHGLQDTRLNPYGRSLALFGLPLTEARTETNSSGDTVVTQWFERARFEWHPGNNPEFRVLLGLLGREIFMGPAIGIATYSDPARTWTIEYPATLLHAEDLGDGIIIFISQDRSTFMAVDSYVASGNAYGNTGEDLRNRARDTLDRIYGQAYDETDIIASPGGRWETGITFTTSRGSKGEAVYEQRGRNQGNLRVNGVLYGYKAANEASILPQLQAMRFSFRTGAAGAREIDRARESLGAYFSLLNAGRYGEAINYYGGSYEFLQGANPNIPSNDYVALMEWGCSGLLQCLPLRSIVSESPVSVTESRFVIEFSNKDGSLFRLGPCCGETGDPITEFTYTVKKVGDRYLVQELPVYVP